MRAARHLTRAARAVYGALPYANDYIAPGIGGMAGLANTLAQRLLAAPQPGSVT